MIKSDILNIMLLIANLFAAGILFLYINGKERPAPWTKLFPEAATAILEFAVYAAGVIRLADLILQGIALAGGESRALFAVRILLAESLLLLFPLGKLQQRWEREESGLKICAEPGNEGMGRQAYCMHGRNGWRGILKEGEYLLDMVLLLGLTLRGWWEPELMRAFAGQVWLLLLFFCYGFLKNRRRRREQEDWDPAKAARADAFRIPDFQGKTDFFQEKTALQSHFGNAEQTYHMEYLRNVEEQYQRTRELWHDLKNHIRVLEILAEENRFGELTDYLDSFRRDVERRMVPARTGCAPVDALLGDKLYQAGKQNVEMKLELCTLAQTGIEEVDLCVILGNLLDNALEACAGLSGEKWMKVRIRREEEFYYITVVNSAKEPVREGEDYLSGKRDRDNGVGHGLGLRSAQRIAHRYGGLLVTDYSDGEFRTVVRLQGYQ